MMADETCCRECREPLTKDEVKHVAVHRGLCWPCFIVNDNLRLGMGTDPLDSYQVKANPLSQQARYTPPRHERK